MRPVAGIALAIVAGGCDLVFPPGGGPRDADGGSGGDPDARPDGTQTDRDGDGIANTDDRCPDDYNPLDLDEDADGTPDACDDCIGVYGPQSDGDNDKIGDACDLFPADGNTQLILRILVENPDPGAWLADTGAFIIEPDQVVQIDDQNNDANLMWNGALPAGGTLWVETGFLPTTPGASNIAIGVWLDADAAPTPANGHRCDVHTTPLGNDLEVIGRVSGSDVATGSAGSLVGLDDPFILQALTTGENYQCSQVGQVPFTSIGTPIDPRRLGLHTRLMAGIFRYVLVYHQP